MTYIEKTLGVTAKYEPWDDFESLPAFIPEYYEFQKTKLGDSLCLFVKPKREMPTIPAIKKHFEIIGGKARIPRVAVLENISTRQRKALISAQIPFVAEGSQLYLPFMGISLTERFSKPKAVPDTLMPSAQMLLFYYIYQGCGKLYTNGMAEKLKVSKMQITRAVRQLAALEILKADKDETRVYIEAIETCEELFTKAKPHILNPVHKKVFVDTSDMPPNLPISGETALARYSRLSEPSMPVYAYCGKASDLNSTDVPVDSEQAEVEIWHYTPTLLSKSSDVADPLSVVASLLSVDDPRVEMAAEEVFEKVFNGDIWSED